MISNSLAQRDIESVLHPQTNLKKHLEVGPKIFNTGEGSYLINEAGEKFLDSGAGLWCTTLGYGNERVAKVAYEAMCNLPYSQIFRHMSHEPAIELCETLLEMAPVPMSKVLLQSSGSEANDTIVKIIWYYWTGKGQPERRKIISRTGSYHGSTCVAISLTGNTQYHRSFGLPFDGFLKTNGLNHYRDARPGESEEEFSKRLAAELEAQILEEGPETIAAFFADPVQGNAGALPPPAGYFEHIQKVLKKYDILFVADEVICGFGRTGEMWGSQTYGLEPDLISSAKGLSAAMQPISAVLINEKVFEVMVEESDRIGAFVHGFTYAGHPVASAVASEVIRIYEEMDLVGHVKSMEPAFADALQVVGEHPLVANPGHVGLIGGVEIVADEATRTSFAPEARITDRLDAATHANQLLVRIASNRIAYSPPLIITEDQIGEMRDKTLAALDAAWGGLKADGFV